MSAPWIRAVGDRRPAVDPDAWVAPGATVVGEVTLGAGSSVWYGVVLRADEERMVIGERTNIQDNCVLHCDPGVPTLIGAGVTIGHNATVHGSVVDDDVLIGMGAVLLNGVHVESDVIIGAGAVVPEGMRILSGSLVLGVPARVRGTLTDEQRAGIRLAAAGYVERAARHRGEARSVSGVDVAE